MTDYVEDKVLNSALELAYYGMRIFPLHRIVNGICTCGGKPNCKPGKHPRISRWPQRATTNKDKIRSWFLKEFPQSNIGVLTGITSGLWVLDIDIEHGGYDSLKQLEEHFGQLPKTVRVRTGGGGEHYYFKYSSDQRIPSSIKALGPGLDVRGERAYAISPSSNHISGNYYSWICKPNKVDIVPAPEWLLNLIKQSSKKHKTRALNQSDFDETFQQIVNGTRNITLFEKFACHLRDKNISKIKVEIICLAINAYSCRHPLEESEVRGVIKSAFSYPVRPSRIRCISDGSERILELLRLWSEYDENGSVECSLDEIAIEVGLAREGTRKCLRQLETFGFLHTQEFRGKLSKYTPLSSSDSNQSCSDF